MRTLHTVVYVQFLRSTFVHKRLTCMLTCAWPVPQSPPQSNPRAVCQYGGREVLASVVTEHSQTTVVRTTSAICCQPWNSLVFVHLVARRGDLKCILTASVCDRNRNKIVVPVKCISITLNLILTALLLTKLRLAVILHSENEPCTCTSI